MEPNTSSYKRNGNDSSEAVVKPFAASHIEHGKASLIVLCVPQSPAGSRYMYEYISPLLTKPSIQDLVSFSQRTIDSALSKVNNLC